MPLPPNPRSIAEILPGADIHDVLDNQLYDAGFTGRATKKYGVEGYPDAIVRLNEGLSWERAQTNAAALAWLPHYNIATLPYLPVQHGGEVYIVTQRVIEGRPCEELLVPNASPRFVGALDVHWTKLTRCVAGAKQFDRPYPEDAQTPNQYMLGRVSTDHVDRFRLVDLGEFAIDFATSSAPAAYSARLLDLASATIDIEQRSSGELPKTRRALLGALRLAEQVTSEERMVAGAVRQSLAENVRLTYLDEGEITEQDP